MSKHINVVILQEVAAKVFKEVADVHALTMLRQEVSKTSQIFAICCYCNEFLEHYSNTILTRTTRPCNFIRNVINVLC
jgi:hypothetical protein